MTEPVIPEATPEWLEAARQMDPEGKDHLIGMLLRWWAVRSLNGPEDDAKAGKMKRDMYRAIRRRWHDRKTR